MCISTLAVPAQQKRGWVVRIRPTNPQKLLWWIGQILFEIWHELCQKHAGGHLLSQSSRVQESCLSNAWLYASASQYCQYLSQSLWV